MAKAQPIAGLDAQAPTTRNVRLILRQRLDEMYAHAPFVNSPDNVQQLHDLRIAAKRVRYTLEVFEGFLPTTSKDLATELATLQDELGQIHDCEVMLALLRQLLEAEPPPPDETRAAPVEALPNLLAPELAHAVLGSNHAPALSPKERRGLFGLLHRQEQRRTQAFAAFRQHWQAMEDRAFRATFLEMLSGTR